MDWAPRANSENLQWVYNDPMRRIENLALDEIEQMTMVGDTAVHRWGWRNIARELYRWVRGLEQQRNQSHDLRNSASGQ